MREFDGAGQRGGTVSATYRHRDRPIDRQTIGREGRRHGDGCAEERRDPEGHIRNTAETRAVTKAIGTSPPALHLTDELRAACGSLNAPMSFTERAVAVHPDYGNVIHRAILASQENGTDRRTPSGVASMPAPRQHKG